MQRHKPTSESEQQNVLGHGHVKLACSFANYVYAAFCVCYETILNTENKSLLKLISFKIHCIPFSPTAETHDYNEIDEFTQRQQTATKEQSHVASNIRSEIVEVVCRFFFCYFRVQSFVVNMHLYHSLPDVVLVLGDFVGVIR